MNQLVPQPSATTRSPAYGRASTDSDASAAASRQHAGWEAISSEVRLICSGGYCSIMFGVKLERA